MDINAESLSMDETEFKNNMESAHTLLSTLSITSDKRSQVDQNFKHVTPNPIVPKPASSSKGPLQGLVESSETKYRKDASLSLNKIPSIRDLENRGASIILKEDEVSRVFRDFPFLFSQGGDLTVGDVEDLLNNYKKLVFKYVCLAKGLGKVMEVYPNETESEKVTENDYMKKELSRVVDDSGERSVSELENIESMVVGQSVLQSKGEGNV